MNTNLAAELTAIVTDKNDKQLFVQKNGLTYKVLSETDAEIGDVLKGFAYTDKSDQLVFITDIPEIRPDHYGWGEVVKVNHRLGVFVDVNWPGKDLVVSMDDLPAEGRLWPKEGNKLFVTVTVDKKDRIWAKPADEDLFFHNFVEGTKDMHNAEFTGVTFSLKKSGTYALTEDKHILFIHPSEREKEPRLGETISSRVIGLREDGVLYASMKPRAHEVMEEDSLMLLEVLKRSENHKIPYHNKTNPEDIKLQFGISKGQFKRAVGRLMKQGWVSQDESGTFLIKNPEDEQK